MTSLQRSLSVLALMLAAPFCGAAGQTLPSDLAPTAGGVSPASSSPASSAVFPGPRRQRHAQMTHSRHVAPPPRASADKAPSDVAEASAQCKAKTLVVYEPIEDIEKEQNDEMMAILAKDDAKEAAKDTSKAASTAAIRTP